MISSALIQTWMILKIINNMKTFKEKDFTRGWFVGDFIPTAFNTKNCEVAVKRFKKGDYENPHYHKIATEINLIISGKAIINNETYYEGDVILVEPNQVVEFSVQEDCVLVAVKIPCAIGDKYEVEKNIEKE